MASDDKLAKIQEIVNRGLVDQLSPEKQAKVSEMVARGLITLPQQAPQEQEGFLSAAADTAGTIGQGMIAESAAGLSGLARGAYNQGAEALGFDPSSMTAEQQVQATRQQLAPNTPSERSQAQLQDVGMVAENVMEGATNTIGSGLVGIGETGYALSQGEDFNTSMGRGTQSIEDIKADRNASVGGHLGEKVYQETGSPLAATLAGIAPEAVAELVTGGYAGAGIRGAKQAAGQATRQGMEQAPSAIYGATEKALDGMNKAEQAVQKGIETASKIFNKQTKAKQEIGVLLNKGSTDKKVAGWELVPKEGSTQLHPSPLKPVDKGDAIDTLKETIKTGTPKVKKEPLARETLKQGFDKGIIATVAGSSIKDKSKMLEMVETMERGKANAREAALNRPSDFAGDSLVERLDYVVGKNQQAGKQLNIESKKLKGKKVDGSSATSEFYKELDEIDVKIKDDGTPNFKGSDIEGAEAAEKLIAKIIKRLNSNKGNPDAHDLHRLKRFIDEQVTYGKSGEGLTGVSIGIVKKLRRDVDTILDDNFPDYDKVNTIYADTIGAIDGIQDVAGRKMKLDGLNADKATGTLLRRLLSNQKSRVTLLDSINNLEASARRNGADFEDDILSQVLFVDELDRVFGAVARTSFQGQIKQGIDSAANTANQGAWRAGVDLAGSGAEKLRGINEEAAFKSIKELLKKDLPKNSKLNPRQQWQQTKNKLLNGLGKMEGSEEEILVILLEGGMTTKTAEKLIKRNNRSEIANRLDRAKRKTL